MSAGTKATPVRITPRLRAWIEETISRRNLWARGAPWSVSDFIRIACLEKIHKMNRSRTKGRSHKGQCGSRQLVFA